MFAAIGIVKGEPFNPDATTRSILDKAAKTAYKMSRVIGFEKNVSGALLSHLSRQTLGQSCGGRNALEPRWRDGPSVAQNRPRIPGPRCADLVLHRLLLDKPGDAFADPWKRCEVYGRLYRQRRNAVVGWWQLFQQPTSGHSPSTRLRTRQGSPTGGLSRRLAHATSPLRIPMDRLTSI